jgi:flavorubredoxin
MSEVHEIADGVYRLSTYLPGIPLTFTQFLIKDERPLLFHTGSKAMFPETIEAVRKIIDPKDLRYISWSHLEADECGAVTSFVQAAPQAELVHGQIGVMIDVGSFFDRPVTAMSDDSVLDLGRHTLRFLVTPNVPHAWDAIMVYEETTGTLFVSDLFTVFGQQPPSTESDPIEPSMAALAQLPGYLPLGAHTNRVFDRLIALQPKVLAGHHGPAFVGGGAKVLDDLRGELFKQAGSVP